MSDDLKVGDEVAVADSSGVSRRSTMPQYITRTTQLAVVEQGKPLFDDSATIITITDESGGEFVEVRQCRGARDRSIAIDPAEWPAICDAVNQLIEKCRTYE